MTQVVSNVTRITVVTSPGYPAWRTALAQWQWVQLTNTAAFSGVTPTTNPGGDYKNRLDSWNGFCAKDSLVLTAGMGGHADYAGNEAYKLDLSASTPTWVILCQPTPAAQLTYDQPYYLDGRPTSTHQYYSQYVIGDEIILTDFGSAWGSGNFNTDECVAFDLLSNDWKPAGTYPDSPSGPYATARCIDPRDGTIYYAGDTALHKRHPVTGVYTKLANWPENGSSVYYRAGAVDTLRNRVVFFGNDYVPTNGGLLYNITSNTMSSITFSGTGVSDIVAEAGNSAWYDSGLDRFLVKTGSGNTIYSVNPTTFECSLLSTTGGSSISNAINGVFNKFVYVPSLGGYYYQPNHASNGWFLAAE